MEKAARATRPAEQQQQRSPPAAAARAGSSKPGHADDSHILRKEDLKEAVFSSCKTSWQLSSSLQLLAADPQRSAAQPAARSPSPQRPPPVKPPPPRSARPQLQSPVPPCSIPGVPATSARCLPKALWRAAAQLRTASAASAWLARALWEVLNAPTSRPEGPCTTAASAAKAASIRAKQQIDQTLLLLTYFTVMFTYYSRIFASFVRVTHPARLIARPARGTARWRTGSAPSAWSWFRTMRS